MRLISHLINSPASAAVSVDDPVVKRQQRWFNGPSFEAHEIDPGQGERGRVRIEKDRLSLFASRSRVFVNSRLMEVREGASERLSFGFSDKSGSGM